MPASRHQLLPAALNWAPARWPGHCRSQPTWPPHTRHRLGDARTRTPRSPPSLSPQQRLPWPAEQDRRSRPSHLPPWCPQSGGALKDPFPLTPSTLGRAAGMGTGTKPGARPGSDTTAPQHPQPSRSPRGWPVGQAEPGPGARQDPSAAGGRRNGAGAGQKRGRTGRRGRSRSAARLSTAPGRRYLRGSRQPAPALPPIRAGRGAQRRPGAGATPHLPAG